MEGAETADRELRRVARPRSVSYRLAVVLYVLGLVSLFGAVGVALGSVLQAQVRQAVEAVLGGLAGWWICAGIAVRLGLSPRVFFARLGSVLER